MEWMKLGLVIVLLARAIDTDLKRDVIENKWIAYGLGTGLLYAGLNGGIDGLLRSVKSAGLVLLVLFGLFLIKGLGAGDIKLFCVLAVFYPYHMMEIVMVSFLLAAGYMIGKMVFRLLRKMSPYIPGETIHFSIPIACSVFIVQRMLMS